MWLLCQLLAWHVSQEERSKVDDLRGTPMSVGTLEEIIDDNHAIVSTSVGSEHYVSILSFVDKDLLEPGCSVLLNHKVQSTLLTIEGTGHFGGVGPWTPEAETHFKRSRAYIVFRTMNEE